MTGVQTCALPISEEEFRKKIEDDELVEWEEIYGDFYGTLRSEVQRSFRSGKSMLFDVDVKGALSIKKRYPEAILIFIKPPSNEVLKKRLVKRKTESEEALQKRLERVPMELEQEKLFDYSLVNEDVKTTVNEIEKILGLRKKV